MRRPPTGPCATGPRRECSDDRGRPLEERMTMLMARALALVVVAALAAGAAPARSGLLPAAGCGARQLSQPFAPWLDFAHYFLVPNGGFEQGSSGWTLGPGAATADGNEPFHVRSVGDSRSLSIPAGGWAQTDPLCVDGDEPTLRFFA